MSQLKFQLDFLDAIVGALRRMAGEHEDMARSLHSHAGSAQSLGADGWIVDQVHFAASLLSGHPDLFYQLSSELDRRLRIAHTVADEWQGAQTGLRVALTGALTATTGLLAHAAGSTKANQSAQKAEGKTGITKGVLGTSSEQVRPTDRLTSGVAKATSDLRNEEAWSAADRSFYPDCWHFIKEVMRQGGVGLTAPTAGTVYAWSTWSQAGYKPVAAWGDAAALGADFPPGHSDAVPLRGSFVEFGRQTTNGYDDSGHHSAYYLGQRDQAVYVAESNYNGAPPEIHKWLDGKMSVVPTSSVPPRWDADDANSRKQLKIYADSLGPRGATAVFYQPETSPSTDQHQSPDVAAPQFNLGPAPLAGQSGTLKTK